MADIGLETVSRDLKVTNSVVRYGQLTNDTVAFTAAGRTRVNS